MNSKASFYTHALCVRITSSKRSSVLNTCSNDFIRRYMEHVTSRKRKIALGVAMSGEGGIAGEGRVIGKPKFH